MSEKIKNCLDSLRSMASHTMQKQGIFTEGTNSIYRWWNTRTKEQMASVNYEYKNSQLILSYKGNDKDYKYAINIVRTACNYGGSRAWFICPVAGCNKRVGKLYIGSSLIFACRHCNNANYTSQQDAKKWAALHNMHKVRDKLGWDYQHVSFLQRIRKPKHMHRKTFDALVAKHDAYEQQYLKAFQAFIDKLGMTGS